MINQIKKTCTSTYGYLRIQSHTLRIFLESMKLVGNVSFKLLGQFVHVLVRVRHKLEFDQYLGAHHLFLLRMLPPSSNTCTFSPPLPFQPASFQLLTTFHRSLAERSASNFSVVCTVSMMVMLSDSCAPLSSPRNSRRNRFDIIAGIVVSPCMNFSKPTRRPSMKAGSSCFRKSLKDFFGGLGMSFSRS